MLFKDSSPRMPSIRAKYLIIMRKSTPILVLLLCLVGFAQAQQDAQFTKYMFNSLVYNPGYAGSKDHMTMGLIHRTQWHKIQGGPSTQSFTLHTPLPNERVGVGLYAINDVIGPTQSMNINLSYAYRIPVGPGKLSIGLQGGVMNWRADFSQITLPDISDEAFANASPSLWLPNFGVGLYYYTPKFYFGVASPHLIEYDLREDPISTQIWAKTYRHYYMTAGAAIPLKGESLIFKPSLIVKNVGLFSIFSKDEIFQEIGAPTSIDIDLSLLFYQALWVGASYRTSVEQVIGQTSSHDSADVWASYYLANGLRIGAAYDYTLSKISSVAGQSFEVMVGYEFNYNTKRAVTPRYF